MAQATHTRNPYRSIVHEDLKTWNRYTVLHCITLAIGTFLWLPLRAGMVLVSYIMCWLVSTVGSYGLEYPTDFTVVQKMPILSVERRKYVTPLIKFFFKGVMFGFGVFHVQVKNLENLSDDAKIVTFGPHSTLFDTAIIYAFGRRTFSGITAAAEFFRPLSGKMLRIGLRRH